MKLLQSSLFLGAKQSSVIHMRGVLSVVEVDAYWSHMWWRWLRVMGYLAMISYHSSCAQAHVCSVRSSHGMQQESITKLCRWCLQLISSGRCLTGRQMSPLHTLMAIPESEYISVAKAATGWIQSSVLCVRRYMNGKSDKLYEGAFDTGCRVSLDMGACGLQEVAFFHQHSDNVDWVFVDHPSYHRPGAPLFATTL